MIHDVACTAASQCERQADSAQALNANEARITQQGKAQLNTQDSTASKSLASPEELASLGGFDIPSAEQARHLMRELNWGEHLDVMDLNAAAGESWLHLYALDEAAKFFRYGTAGLGFKTGGSGSVSYANQDRLVTWIESTIGDTSLAEALRKRLAEANSYHDVILIVSRLIDLRCSQLALIAQD